MGDAEPSQVDPCFPDRVALTPSPAYADARVLAVRSGAIWATA